MRKTMRNNRRNIQSSNRFNKTIKKGITKPIIKTLMQIEEESGRWSLPRYSVPVLTDEQKERVRKMKEDFEYKRSPEYMELLWENMMKRMEAKRASKIMINSFT